MKKAFHNILVITLITTGAVFLIGKYHFILGSLLGLSQVPIINPQNPISNCGTTDTKLVL